MEGIDHANVQRITLLRRALRSVLSLRADRHSQTAYAAPIVLIRLSRYNTRTVRYKTNGIYLRFRKQLRPNN